ncbi:GntR family transcriptional regulator [Anaerotruncus rubiinfantis]|uniref:GntR family transcriptional regulator n=1 Tax=Anaerotruncus rubiinfantis TaxID=1720200 RepID=UPI00083760B8|nr:GntR family transcriptional regulator [Anaerotruncus rubiinfantis]
MQDFIETNSTVASRVTEKLRSDIITKKIAAGSRITIKEISERYGTSNMPVREAFRILEGENLLKFSAYKGAEVLKIDISFIKDIYGVLRALEDLIYETALPAVDDELLDQLTKTNEKIRSLQDRQVAAYVDLNTSFHQLIIARGTNEKAIELYTYYNRLIREIRKSYTPSFERIKQVIPEHESIIGALREKDVLKLKAAVDTHVMNAQKNFSVQYNSEN